MAASIPIRTGGFLGEWPSLLKDKGVVY
ncbi:hypothetical protein NHJ6243_003220 [Beauveria neobassiana]